MDELTWGVVNDSSGNDVQVDAVNGALTAYDFPIVPSSPGTCRYGLFDGQDDYLSLPALPDLNGSFTIAAWIRPNEVGKDQRIFADDRNNSRGFAFSLGDGGDGRLRFFSRGVSPVILDSPVVISADTWHFVAVVHDAVSKTRKIYVDGGSTPVAQDSYTGAWGTDPGPASIGGEVDGTSEGNSNWRFNGAIDEVSIYQRPLGAGELAALKDQTHVCGTLADREQPAFAFNCVDPGNDPLTGRLRTKLVGAPFVLDVAALRDANSDGVADAVETEYAKATDRTVTVELVDTSGGGSCATLPALSPAVSGSVTFRAADAGRNQSAAFSVNRAYRSVGCRVTDANDAPTVVGCSTDSFSVRPATFGLQPPALNNAGASGAPAVKVGAAFSLSVSAGPGYDGTPLVTSGSLQPHAAALATGLLTGAFGNADPSTGIATGTGFTYSEVGNFRFAPNAIRDTSFTAVDQPGDCVTNSVATVADSTGRIGCDISNASATAWVGRFTPDHFDVQVTEPGELANTCTGFSYAGTAIAYAVEPTLLITAKTADGTTTRNYTGSYSKLQAGEVLIAGLTGDATTVGADASTPVAVAYGAGLRVLNDNGDGTHTVTLSGDTFTYGHGANEQVGEFVADVSREITAINETEDGTTATGLPLGLAPVGVPIRYGRLRIGNAHGSELQTLPMPMQVEYFAGAAVGFQPNGADGCTSINDLQLVDGDTSDSLTPGASCIWDSLGASGGFACAAAGAAADQYRASPIGGDFNLNLMAPAGGASGVLQVTAADTPSWLEFNWQGSGDSKPVGLASFGIYRGNPRVIFMREVR